MNETTKWIQENGKWILSIIAGAIIAFTVAQDQIAENVRRIEAIESHFSVQPTNLELKKEIDEIQKRLDRIENKVDRLIEMK